MKIIISTENECYEISLQAAYLSGYIKNLIESSKELTEDNQEKDFTIPLLNINGGIIKKIIEFYEYFNNDKENSEKIKNIPKPLPSENIEKTIPKWYYDFINNMCIDDAFSVIKAANFLEISELLELSCAMIASIIRGKSVDEIREKFGIINDFTPEEEEEIHNENKWCEDL